VRHARYAIFQMAEVAVPNELFERIQRLITPPPKSDSLVLIPDKCN
jgi:hypothetical protein